MLNKNLHYHKKQKRHQPRCLFKYAHGVARGIRTPDRRLRRPLLCPAELLQQSVGNEYYILFRADCKVLIRIKLTIIKLRVESVFLK